MRHERDDHGYGMRTSVLWGKGGRHLLLLALVAAIVGAFAGAARADSTHAYITSTLREQAQAHPAQSFDVVVQGRAGSSTADVAAEFTTASGGVAGPEHRFTSINGVAGELSGTSILKLADSSRVDSIVLDAETEEEGWVEQSVWRATTGIDSLWGSALSPAPNAPAIAVVDSGVDASKLADFGTRLVANVDFSGSGSTVDAQGHGTMVAGLAAGAGATAPGIAQNAPIVSLKTADATGASRVSDVIAACDWILQHKGKYNIRVANFSMRSGSSSSFRYDPLDKAVEALWFNGVVVVAAVGNYGTAGKPVPVQYAPGNDPFVISVGATDTQGTVPADDDTIAPWSAYGHTLDGFAKPELSAPGRWIVAAVPAGSTLPTTAPDRVVAPGYMWMSGTSLSAPMVAGAAAQILARHPDWSPDEVKGALLESASKLAGNKDHAAGVGELNAAAAAALAAAPNPHTNLNRFLKSTGGSTYFDGYGWQAALKGTLGWSTTDWSTTGWSATDWSATDWSTTGWSATDWSATDWSAIGWATIGWSTIGWSTIGWSTIGWAT